uniref:Uncharacterized protein n=1 Tax=uncultured prokaryote TaxID=198431 RepID=A0A0H5QLA7_9ZZZZ|nr:hypothetical protein [uncultured prokaryote]
MTAQVTYKVIDHSGEYSTVKVNVPDIDETNFAAIETFAIALQAAVVSLTAGNIASRQLTAYTKPVNDNYPAEEYAQRETGLRLFYKDNVNAKKFHVTIPAPDLSLIAVEGSDFVDMSLSVVSTVTAAMEAFMVSPYGNPITFYKGVIVGRRN